MPGEENIYYGKAQTSANPQQDSPAALRW